LSIEAATNALIRARNLLLKTQVVSVNSPLLMTAAENEAAFMASETD